MARLSPIGKPGMIPRSTFTPAPNAALPCGLNPLVHEDPTQALDIELIDQFEERRT